MCIRDRLYADHTNPMVQALMEMMYNTDRVLIIIQQNGGNDGLNTIFPLDQYDNLKAARSNMLMPATSILKLTDKTGIHPAMEGVYNLFKDGKAGVVQSVGYPSFNYSHFRATDIWLTGSDADEYLDSGWAGRYLNYEYPNYPVGFPNTTMPDPLAIRVGESVGLGLQMMGVNTVSYTHLSNDEKGRKTVLDIVQPKINERVYPIGRLDRMTTGLLILTNDGELAKTLSHPSSEVRKVYSAVLNKALGLTDLDKIAKGVELEDGKANIDGISYIDGAPKNEIGITLHSGKNRIVRRIFESLGYDVVKLDRVSFAGLTKKDLPRGHFRHLTEKEVTLLKHFGNRKKK